MQSTFYFIRSDSRPNLFHRVSETAGRYVCECEDYTYRRRECRHIEQVKRGCGVVAQPKRHTAIRPVPQPVRVQPSRRLRSQADVDELYGGEPAPVRRGRDVLMGGLREPVAS